MRYSRAIEYAALFNQIDEVLRFLTDKFCRGAASTLPPSREEMHALRLLVRAAAVGRGPANTEKLHRPDYRPAVLSEYGRRPLTDLDHHIRKIPCTFQPLYKQVCFKSRCERSESHPMPSVILADLDAWITKPRQFPGKPLGIVGESKGTHLDINPARRDRCYQLLCFLFLLQRLGQEMWAAIQQFKAYRGDPDLLDAKQLG